MGILRRHLCTLFRFTGRKPTWRKRGPAPSGSRRMLVSWRQRCKEHRKIKHGHGPTSAQNHRFQSFNVSALMSSALTALPFGSTVLSIHALRTARMALAGECLRCKSSIPTQRNIAATHAPAFYSTGEATTRCTTQDKAEKVNQMQLNASWCHNYPERLK